LACPEEGRVTIVDKEAFFLPAALLVFLKEGVGLDLERRERKNSSFLNEQRDTARKAKIKKKQKLTQGEQRGRERKIKSKINI